VSHNIIKFVEVSIIFAKIVIIYHDFDNLTVNLNILNILIVLTHQNLNNLCQNRTVLIYYDSNNLTANLNILILLTHQNLITFAKIIPY
jgi:hypothetical protein